MPFFTLQDSSGNLWAVTASALTGELITALVGPGVAANAFLNDPSLTTSWQVGITTGGQLTTTPVINVPGYSVSIPLTTAYSLAVLENGQLQTIPAPAVVSAVAPAIRSNLPTSGQIVPLNASPNQNFKITLQVDGAPLTLNLAIHWNAMAGYWIMSISDSQNNLILDSIPLITGWYPGGNLLGQYGYLHIGSAYILNEGNTNSDYPGQSDLGIAFVLLWDDTAVQEVAA